ncbi:MAG: L,D-transpeptidase, partial [Propionibacteriaceae bacterium]|nr:L,D-transpeptidase [Propionibacteriaceae bacterium]
AVRYNPLKAKAAHLVLSVNETTLMSYLEKSFSSVTAPAVPASVAYNADAGTFAVAPSKAGIKPDAAAVAQAIEAGGGVTAPLEVATIARDPAITDAAAQTAADAANARIAQAYVLTAGSKQYVIPAATLASWTVVNQDVTAGTITTTVDEAKVQAELPPLLTENLTAPMEPGQNMVGPSGQYLGHVKDGKPGTAVADPAGVTAAVIAALGTGTGLATDVAVAQNPATTENAPMDAKYLVPNGAKWVEVNTSARTATRYEGTTALTTWPVVVGTSGKTTPGIWHVYVKVAEQTMTGGTPGEPGYYKVEGVTWIAYFNGGIGFHANWWASPGTAASHGCVGLTRDRAKEMYDWIDVGTLVVVHT